MRRMTVRGSGVEGRGVRGVGGLAGVDNSGDDDDKLGLTGGGSRQAQQPGKGVGSALPAATGSAPAFSFFGKGRFRLSQERRLLGEGAYFLEEGLGSGEVGEVGEGDVGLADVGQGGEED